MEWQGYFIHFNLLPLHILHNLLVSDVIKWAITGPSLPTADGWISRCVSWKKVYHLDGILDGGGGVVRGGRFYFPLAAGNRQLC